MKSNGMQLMLRSLRRVAMPVMLLAAASLVGCGDSGNCKDLCDGTDREIEVCRAACDGIIL